MVVAILHGSERNVDWIGPRRGIIFHPITFLFLRCNCPASSYNKVMLMPLQIKNESFFTTAEAAAYLGFAEDTVRRYVYRGLISGHKLGKNIVVSKSECDRYRKEKREPGRQKKNS
jgi:excisionase family DNA binding protein